MEHTFKICISSYFLLMEAPKKSGLNVLKKVIQDGDKERF